MHPPKKSIQELSVFGTNHAPVTRGRDYHRLDRKTAHLAPNRITLPCRPVLFPRHALYRPLYCSVLCVCILKTGSFPPAGLEPTEGIPNNPYAYLGGVSPTDFDRRRGPKHHAGPVYRRGEEGEGGTANHDA